MRARRASMSASGISTVNGRISVPAATSVALISPSRLFVGLTNSTSGRGPTVVVAADSGRPLARRDCPAAARGISPSQRRPASPSLGESRMGGGTGAGGARFWCAARGRLNGVTWVRGLHAPSAHVRRSLRRGRTPRTGSVPPASPRGPARRTSPSLSGSGQKNGREGTAPGGPGTSARTTRSTRSG